MAANSYPSFIPLLSKRTTDKKRLDETDNKGAVRENRKHSKGKHKDGGEPVPSRAIAWCQEKLEITEEINMHTFSDHFGFKCEEDAHAAFCLFCRQVCYQRRRGVVLVRNTRSGGGMKVPCSGRLEGMTSQRMFCSRRFSASRRVFH